MPLTVASLPIEREPDVVAVRQRSRDVAAGLGFSPQDQTRIATAVSEIARNAFAYGQQGRAEFEVEGQDERYGDTVGGPRDQVCAAGHAQTLVIRVTDRGPGIARPEQLLAAARPGAARPPDGVGLGIVGSMRLMDQCEIDSTPGAGTTVTLRKWLPETAPPITRAMVDAMRQRLAETPKTDSFAELQQQNRELVAMLAELRERQDELTRLARELEDTNRGVVALYAELDERADHLRRADDMKSRFLSNMSHEFRTPLSSIRALSALLLQRIDGELSIEQEQQVTFIRTAAEDLSEIVDDLLDLAKIESGKIEVRPAEFDVPQLFSALRGMLRPLLANTLVELVFEVEPDTPSLYADEGKIAQILRNFISNALKFTERGEVRVSARLEPDCHNVTFTVADTGIGIAAADQPLIFEEFGQIANRLQRHVKGTGLGLPLCRKLAALLGGSIGVTSVEGAGSTFFATIPVTSGAAPQLADADDGAAAHAAAHVATQEAP
jgi:signal transduction histidine kinase